jgi:hypothetical protein
MKKVLLISVAFGMCSLAHAAPRMLKSECHETEDHIRTCLAPGEAPVVPLSKTPAVVPPTPIPQRQSVPEQSVGPPQTSAVQPVRPEAPPPAARSFFFPPPVVESRRNQTCQTQCYNRAGARDCRTYCW